MGVNLAGSQYGYLDWGIIWPATRGLSGYRARRRVADSQGPVLLASLSLNK